MHCKDFYLHPTATTAVCTRCGIAQWTTDHVTHDPAALAEEAVASPPKTFPGAAQPAEAASKQPATNSPRLPGVPGDSGEPRRCHECRPEANTGAGPGNQDGRYNRKSPRRPHQPRKQLHHRRKHHRNSRQQKPMPAPRAARTRTPPEKIKQDGSSDTKINKKVQNVICVNSENNSSEMAHDTCLFSLRLLLRCTIDAHSVRHLSYR